MGDRASLSGIVAVWEWGSGSTSDRSLIPIYISYSRIQKKASCMLTVDNQPRNIHPIEQGTVEPLDFKGM